MNWIKLIEYDRDSFFFLDEPERGKDIFKKVQNRKIV